MASPLAAPSISFPGLALIKPPPTTILLLVFIHGFKGSSVSFSSFPSRLVSILSASLPNYSVHSLVYPTYDTRGSLENAVDQFIGWLTGAQVERQMEVWPDGFPTAGEGRGRVRTILLAHSMGGLLAADCASRVWRELGIVGVVAYDTPYYGLNHSLITSQGSKYFSYAQSGHQILDAFGLSPFSSNASSTASAAAASGTMVASSRGPPPTSGGWMPYKIAAGAAGLIAAGGAAYLQRKQIAGGMDWLMSHFEFVGELYKRERLNERVDDILHSTKNGSWGFHCFHISLKKKKDSGLRTFISLPVKDAPTSKFFEENLNKLVDDEIEAHMSMFEANTNDGCYKLGLRTVELITGWLDENEETVKEFDTETLAKELKDAEVDGMKKEGMRSAQEQEKEQASSEAP
ncbi:hypothetical protein BT69DRAFT_1338601 [Atractiella rhizophila]|nr:hypothetical protein BT69DRAFT_1338601 [Atractiella rhizophila]